MRKRELWKGKPVEVERDAKGRFVTWNRLTLEDLQLGLEVEEEAEPLFEPIYRASFGLSAVPLHGKYYGFLLQAWAFEEILRVNMDKLEHIFVREVSKSLGSKAYAEEQSTELMGIEEPSESMVEPAFNRTWEFRVEKDGHIEDSSEGIF